MAVFLCFSALFLISFPALSKRVELGEAFQWTGIICFVGMYLLAFLPFIFDALLVSFFQVWYWWLTFIALASLNLLLLARTARQYRNVFVRCGWQYWLFPVVVLLGVSFYLSNIAPLSGWDALGHWGEWAVDFITHNQDGKLDEPFGRTYHRHPRTVVFLGSIGGYERYVLAGFGSHVSWWLGSLSALMVVAGFALRVTSSSVCALIAGYCYLSLPLIENHVASPGYADIWLGHALVVALVAAVSAMTKGRLIGGGALLICFIPIDIKNTGLLFSVVLIVSIGLGMLSLRLGGVVDKVASRVALGGVAVLAVAVNCIHTSDKAWELEVMGWSYQLKVTSFGQLFYSWGQALFKNASFSLLPVMALQVMVWRSVDTCSLPRDVAASNVVCKYATLGTILVVMLPTLLQQFQAGYAMPGNDVGWSRVLLIATGPLTIFIVHMLGPVFRSRKGLIQTS